MAAMGNLIAQVLNGFLVLQHVHGATGTEVPTLLVDLRSGSGSVQRVQLRARLRGEATRVAALLGILRLNSGAVVALATRARQVCIHAGISRSVACMGQASASPCMVKR